MLFFVFAILVGLVGGIFSIIVNTRAEKQLKKYDKANSDVSCEDVEQLVLKLKELSGFDIVNVSSNNNRITVECKKTSYSICVENNIAYIEYDRNGCGLKASSIGRIIRTFKLAKAGKNATIINGIMDSISGKDATLYKKEYKKISNGFKAMKILFTAMLVFIILTVVNVFNGTSNTAVENIKASEFQAGVTYGEIIDAYFEEQDWTSFVTDNDTACVELNGKSVNQENIRIQFLGEMGLALNNVNLQEFTPYCASFDDQLVDVYSAFEYMYEYYCYS